MNLNQFKVQNFPIISCSSPKSYVRYNSPRKQLQMIELERQNTEQFKNLNQVLHENHKYRVFKHQQYNQQQNKGDKEFQDYVKQPQYLLKTQQKIIQIKNKRGNFYIQNDCIDRSLNNNPQTLLPKITDNQLTQVDKTQSASHLDNNLTHQMKLKLDSKEDDEIIFEDQLQQKKLISLMEFSRSQQNFYKINIQKDENNLNKLRRRPSKSCQQMDEIDEQSIQNKVFESSTDKNQYKELQQNQLQLQKVKTIQCDIKKNSKIEIQLQKKNNDIEIQQISNQEYSDHKLLLVPKKIQEHFSFIKKFKQRSASPCHSINQIYVENLNIQQSQSVQQDNEQNKKLKNYVENLNIEGSQSVKQNKQLNQKLKNYVENLSIEGSQSVKQNKQLNQKLKNYEQNFEGSQSVQQDNQSNKNLKLSNYQINVDNKNEQFDTKNIISQPQLIKDEIKEFDEASLEQFHKLKAFKFTKLFIRQDFIKGKQFLFLHFQGLLGCTYQSQFFEQDNRKKEFIYNFIPDLKSFLHKIYSKFFVILIFPEHNKIVLDYLLENNYLIDGAFQMNYNDTSELFLDYHQIICIFQQKLEQIKRVIICQSINNLKYLDQSQLIQYKYPKILINPKKIELIFFNKISVSKTVFKNQNNYIQKVIIKKDIKQSGYLQKFFHTSDILQKHIHQKILYEIQKQIKQIKNQKLEYEIIPPSKFRAQIAQEFEDYKNGCFAIINDTIYSNSKFLEKFNKKLQQKMQLSQLFDQLYVYKDDYDRLEQQISQYVQLVSINIYVPNDLA